MSAQRWEWRKGTACVVDGEHYPSLKAAVGAAIAAGADCSKDTLYERLRKGATTMRQLTAPASPRGCPSHIARAALTKRRRAERDEIRAAAERIDARKRELEQDA